MLRSFNFRPIALNICNLYKQKINAGISQCSAILHKDATPIRMPALSPTMKEGTIIKWYKKEGDAVNPGDVLCDVQTDKAVVSYDIEEEGILAKIIKGEASQDVAVGSLIALMADTDSDWQNVTVPADDVEQSEQDSSTDSQSIQNHQTDRTQRYRYGPAVRFLIDLYNIDIKNLKPSSNTQHILKGDVLKHISENKLEPVLPTVPLPALSSTQSHKSQSSAQIPALSDAPKAPPIVDLPELNSPNISDGDAPPFIDIPLTGIRKTIARRLSESKSQIPHSYATAEAVIDKLIEARKQYMESGVKVSLNDFIIKASAIALQRVPEVNVRLVNDRISFNDEVDISVAVATKDGLITPIIKQADQLSVKEISERVKDLAGRAKIGRLKPEEFQGGSFSISNLGMFGITEFSAVINPPQACILAVGTSRQVFETADRSSTRMTFTLSSDARLVSDATASMFLSVLREALESPTTITSEVLRTPLINSLFSK